MTTEADGGLSIELDAGSWTVVMPPGSISQLENRGYAIVETKRTVDLDMSAIEIVTLGVFKTSTKLKGFVYADIDKNDEFDEEVDQLLQGLRIILDEDASTLTDDAGRFFFLSVSFGDHILWIGENIEPEGGSDEQDIFGLSVTITLEREARVEFALLWPWTQTGPDQGFLQINVEKSEDD